RHFLQKAATGLAGLGVAQHVSANVLSGTKPISPTYVTQDENKVSLFSGVVKEPIKVVLAADTHLWKNDERGDPYRQYSDRMAKAYNQTVHFKTGEPTHPEKAFEDTVRLAVESGADVLALPGDIFSWPSEAAIEWAYDLLERTGIAYRWVAGNPER